MSHRDMFHAAPHGPHHRRFEKGDVKYVILDLLQQRPSYGYEIIRALEERFGGFYAPSPGAVYPTLQMLEEMGYVIAEQQEGRKVYTISESGRQFLSERENVVEEIRGRMDQWWDREAFEDVRDAARSFAHIAKALSRQARRADPEKMRQARDVLARAQAEIEAILAESETESGKA